MRKSRTFKPVKIDIQTSLVICPATESIKVYEKMKSCITNKNHVKFKKKVIVIVIITVITITIIIMFKFNLIF